MHVHVQNLYTLHNSILTLHTYNINIHVCAVVVWQYAGYWEMLSGVILLRVVDCCSICTGYNRARATVLDFSVCKSSLRCSECAKVVFS